ncbi:hypothetical protein, partial [Ralstonia pseudosolanacearum]|uniref:hypothetical protein n=1 Tax=Ralstonia pseudosolanacearum TaxID=1310165 RepID=UPI003CF70450
QAYEREQSLAKWQELATLEGQHQMLASQAAQALESAEQKQGAAKQQEQYAIEQEVRWHQGQAALLAQQLDNGQPSP